MKNKILLSMLLLAGVVAIGVSPVFAATSATQHLSATLGAFKRVTTDGGNVGSSINESTGSLTTAFTPAFKIETNTSAAQAMTLSCSCDTTTVAQNAFFGDGATGTTYMIFSNVTTLPDVAAIGFIKTGPTATNNPNAIAWAIDAPANVTGLTYTWNNTDKKYGASLAKAGTTSTSLTVPAALPLANTFNFDDETGDYQSNLTLSFNP